MKYDAVANSYHAKNVTGISITIIEDPSVTTGPTGATGATGATGLRELPELTVQMELMDLTPWFRGTDQTLTADRNINVSKQLKLQGRRIHFWVAITTLLMSAVSKERQRSRRFSVTT